MGGTTHSGPQLFKHSHLAMCGCKCAAS